MSEPEMTNPTRQQRQPSAAPRHIMAPIPSSSSTQAPEEGGGEVFSEDGHCQARLHHRLPDLRERSMNGAAGQAGWDRRSQMQAQPNSTGLDSKPCCCLQPAIDGHSWQAARHVHQQGRARLRRLEAQHPPCRSPAPPRCPAACPGRSAAAGQVMQCEPSGRQHRCSSASFRSPPGLLGRVAGKAGGQRRRPACPQHELVGGQRQRKAQVAQHRQRELGGGEVDHGWEEPGTEVDGEAAGAKYVRALAARRSAAAAAVCAVAARRRPQRAPLVLLGL